VLQGLLRRELVPEFAHAARQTTTTPIAQPIMSFRI
jgi:hypothetical protein